jgi:hypothetical protein
MHMHTLKNMVTSLFHDMEHFVFTPIWTQVIVINFDDPNDPFIVDPMTQCLNLHKTFKS